VGKAPPVLSNYMGRVRVEVAPGRHVGEWPGGGEVGNLPAVRRQAAVVAMAPPRLPSPPPTTWPYLIRLGVRRTTIHVSVCAMPMRAGSMGAGGGAAACRRGAPFCCFDEVQAWPSTARLAWA
jgi:hypothetical protein